MMTGHAARVLATVPLIAAWGCRTEPSDPVAPPTPAEQPASAAVNSRPEANSPAPDAASRPQATTKDSAANVQAMFRAMADGKPPPEPPLVHAKAVSTGDPELDPLVSFLKGSFAEEIRAGKPLVIEDHTMLHERGQSHQAYVDSLLEEASDRVPAEMIRDLGDKNRQSHLVWPELGRHVPMHLLSPEDKRLDLPIRSRHELGALLRDIPRLARPDRDLPGRLEPREEPGLVLHERDARP